MTETRECPKCGGPTWDNRATKKSPKAPDWRCKDRENCDGAIWLAREKTNGKAGPALPGEREAATPPAPRGPVPQELVDEYAKSFFAMGKRLLQASENWPAHMKPTASDVQSATACCFIEHNKRVRGAA